MKIEFMATCYESDGSRLQRDSVEVSTLEEAYDLIPIYKQSVQVAVFLWAIVRDGELVDCGKED